MTLVGKFENAKNSIAPKNKGRIDACVRRKRTPKKYRITVDE